MKTGPFSAMRTDASYPPIVDSPLPWSHRLSPLPRRPCFSGSQNQRRARSHRAVTRNLLFPDGAPQLRIMDTGHDATAWDYFRNVSWRRRTQGF